VPEEGEIVLGEVTAPPVHDLDDADRCRVEARIGTGFVDTEGGTRVEDGASEAAIGRTP